MHWTNISCFQLGLLQSSKTTVCKDQVYPLQIEMATSTKHHKGRIPKTYPILPHLQWCLWVKKSTGRVWVFFQYDLQMSNCLWLFPATSHVDNLMRFATRGRKLSKGWDFLGLFTLKIRMIQFDVPKTCYLCHFWVSKKTPPLWIDPVMRPYRIDPKNNMKEINC